MPVGFAARKATAPASAGRFIRWPDVALAIFLQQHAGLSIRPDGGPVGRFGREKPLRAGWFRSEGLFEVIKGRRDQSGSYVLARDRGTPRVSP